VTDYLDYQILFFQWLRHKGEVSYDSVRLNLKSAFPFMTYSSERLFNVFFPLVRLGLVDFVGDGCYSITPCHVVYFEAKQIAVVVNTPVSIKESIIQLGTYISTDAFGVQRIKISKKEIELFCLENNILLSCPNANNILKGFPTIESMVFDFEKCYLPSQGVVLDVFSHTTTECINRQVGIFKEDQDFQKVYVRTNKIDFLIPASTFNPEGRCIADTYIATLDSRRSVVEYCKAKKELSIADVNFPVLLDRALRLPSLYLEQGVFSRGDRIIYSNITVAVAKETYRILGIKKEKK